MDRNTIMGVIAMIAFIFVWYILFPPDQNPKPSQQQQASAAQTEQPASVKPQSADAVVADTAGKTTRQQEADTLSLEQRAQKKFGALAPFYTGTNQKVKVITKRYALEVETKGGQIRPLTLNEYKTYDGKPLPVVTAAEVNKRSFQFRYRSADGQVRQADSRDFYFTPSAQEINFNGTESGTRTLVLRAEIAKDTFMEKRYTFSAHAYDVKCDLVLNNLGEIVTDNYVFFKDENAVAVTEKSREKMLPEVNLSYKPDGEDDVERLEVSETDSIHERVELPIRWYAFRNQFFSSVVIAENRPFMMGGNLYALPVRDMQTVKRFRTDLAMEYKHGFSDTLKLTYYYGPNDVNILQGYKEGMSKLVQLGWGPLRYISLGILYIFKFLENFFSNYGAIIFFLVIIVKIVLSPLTYRSYLSQAKMQIVNQMPEIKELEEKYKDEPQVLQQKKMSFYSGIGVSPLGGCIPALLQFPILIAAFFFFPQSIELRQQPLFWAEDLSTYDSILDFGFSIPLYGDHISLFALLSTLVTLLYTHLQMQNSSSSVPPSMKYVQYAMPIFFLGILNNYSAGLSYYNFISTLFTIGQTFLMKRLIDQDKLHQKIISAKEKAKSSPKKGKLQEFVEARQKKQQELNKIRSGARQKKKH